MACVHILWLVNEPARRSRGFRCRGMLDHQDNQALAVGLRVEVHLCFRLAVCYIIGMSSAVEKAVEALELLPEEMQESAATYLLSQARKFRALRDAIDEGMADVEAGRVVPWDLEEFLKQARARS